MHRWPPLGAPQGGFRPMPHEITNPSEQTRTWQQPTTAINGGRNNIDIATLSTRQQTTMWQQANYLDDSGYNSGATTQASSTSGQNGNFNEQFTSDWNQTSTQPDTAQEQNLDQHISVLIEILNDPDRSLVWQAATMTSNLSKTDAGARAISNSPQMVGTLVKTISTINDDETTGQVAATLQHLSYHDHGSRAIFDSGATFALVMLLSSPVEIILNHALVALHNLLVRQEGSKMAVRLAGGLQQLVALLQRNDVKFLTIVTDCLKILAFGDRENKLLILASGGPVELVRIMRTYDYENLLWTTSRLLKLLSLCLSNKPAIVEAGGMQALTMQLNHHSRRLVQNCMWTLRNLSDIGRTVEPIEGLLQRCIQLLSADDVAIASSAAGILLNLTADNHRNKATVCRMDGINALTATIISLKDHAEVIDPAMCALNHLIANHPGADAARTHPSLSRAIPTLVWILNSRTSRWPVIKSVVELIRNLAKWPANCAVLGDQGAIARLVQVLGGAHGEMGRGRLCVEGVRMEDVVVRTVMALRSFASENCGRMIVRGLNVAEVLEQLASGENERIRRVANELLSDLCEQEVDAFLTELFPRRDDCVATDAPPVLYRIPEHDQEPTHAVDEEQWPQLELTDMFETYLGHLNDQ